MIPLDAVAILVISAGGFFIIIKVLLGSGK